MVTNRTPSSFSFRYLGVVWLTVFACCGLAEGAVGSGGVGVQASEAFEVGEPDRRSSTQSIAVTAQAADGVRQFTDDPLVPGKTAVRAAHFRELRTRIDELRTQAGLSVYAWTDPELTPGVTRIRRVHLMELRTELNQA